jgi:hypothetical protein
MAKTLPRCTTNAPYCPMGLLVRSCLGETDFDSLQQTTELCNLQFRAQQVSYVSNSARMELKTEIPIGLLMRTFDCSRCAVHSSLAIGLNPPKSRGRHLAVDAESDLNILTWITKQAQQNAAATCTHITNYCRELCKFEVSRGWVGSLI